ncbi:clan AA aspartic protease [Leptolyngbya sp. FACHB-1624]|uniref:clan AA aspartic protease n=1 Tax=Leptolyngbya sp. FACHB-1624 TaxID=2692802 RepID=UPI0039EA3A96
MAVLIHGVVDQNCEATVRLVVGNADTERQVVDAIIDTGFTGFLTLPHSVLSTLNLKPYSREEGTLADGSEVIFDVYSGFVIWDGAFRRIDINASDATPLAGMSLLYGYRVQFDTIEGGEVKIQAFHELNQNLQ